MHKSVGGQARSLSRDLCSSDDHVDDFPQICQIYIQYYYRSKMVGGERKLSFTFSSLEARQARL